MFFGMEGQTIDFYIISEIRYSTQGYTRMKKIIWITVFSAVMIILIVLMLYTGISSNSRLEISSDNYTAKVNGLFERVKMRMEELRGYEITIPIKVVDREWVLKRFGSESTDKNEMRDREIMYKALLLVPSDFRFEERKNREVGSYMAFYWNDGIYVVRENFNPENSSGEALAHEIEHAVQKRFDIRSDGTFDGDLAVNAIIEGDAVLAGWLYAGKNVSGMINKTSEEISCSREPVRGYDDDLHQLFYFPYLYGGVYMGKRYIQGGYALVDDILKNPPETTAELIHGREMNFENVTVSISEIKNSTFNFTGFRVIRNDRMGEFLVYLFLSTHINDCEAFKSAEGWHGDRFILMKKGNEYVFGWRIAFYGVRDAEEFERSLIELLNTIGRRDVDGWRLNYSSIEKMVYSRDGRYVSIYGCGKIVDG